MDNESDDDQQGGRKMTASEALDSLDTLKSFVDFCGDNQMNTLLNNLKGKVRALKLQNVRPQRFIPS